MLARVALKALAQTAKRSLRSTPRRLSYDATKAFSRNVRATVVKEFRGELIKEFTSEIGRNMLSSASAARYPSDEDVAMKVRYFADTEFKKSRNNYVRGKGKHILRNAQTFYVFPGTIAVADVEAIALEQAMHAMIRKGHSRETVAAAMYPLSFDSLPTDLKADRIKYGHEDRNWFQYQKRLRRIHTPTGFGHISTIYNGQTGHLEYSVGIGANPNFEVVCDRVCQGVYVKFEHKGKGNIEDFA